MQKEKKMQNNNVSYIGAVQNVPSTLGSGFINPLGGETTLTTTTGTNAVWIDPNFSQYYQWPNTQISYYPYYIPSNPEPTYEIKVEKVANGFIVHKNGQKFVVSKPEEIVKYLKDDVRSK